jgi:hypothetical protein
VAFSFPRFGYLKSHTPDAKVLLRQAVDYPLNPILHQVGAKVQHKTQLQSLELQIGQNLLCVYLAQLLRLEFDDHLALNDDISPSSKRILQ